jgi:uncharacterized protein YqjF (DUF2071 family)
MPNQAAQTVNQTGKFLTAEWRDVVLLNYEVEPALLRRFVPAGTELDFWNGKTFVSLVGFRFLKTRVLGVPIPFHRDFEEVNLRLYVSRREGGELRRGVTFIREIVPRRAVATIARTVYNENYVALPMSHQIHRNGAALEAEYAWRQRTGWSKIRLTTAGHPVLPIQGSEEEFIAEHYWGYAAQRDGGCLEYRVDHPSWKVWTALEAEFSGDVRELYGPEFATILKGKPASAFLADGSEVTVFKGRRI